jgi:hypothetical protein
MILSHFHSPSVRIPHFPKLHIKFILRSVLSLIIHNLKNTYYVHF